MGVELKVYDNAVMTADDFAMIIEHITPSKSGILYGFTPTISTEGTNVVSLSAGWVLIRGRLVKADKTDVTVTLPTSGSKTYNIVLVVKLSDTTAPVSVEFMETMIADTTYFNETHGTAYYKIGQVTAGSGGLSNIVARQIAPVPPTIRTGVTKAVNDPDHRDGDIYIQYKA